eukprot:TRINITY_DN10290_c1_g1_i2.p1 TRINITY_DN10290_c1_g1~~TRINITY_DN10290_c1_g1_i2.p1  ORF type:complete len:111 (+),score=13.31 TRINITY_DN10290_c1_g1_i2:74-406(+)
MSWRPLEGASPQAGLVVTSCVGQAGQARQARSRSHPGWSDAHCAPFPYFIRGIGTISMKQQHPMWFYGFEACERNDPKLNAHWQRRCNLLKNLKPVFVLSSSLHSPTRRR